MQRIIRGIVSLALLFTVSASFAQDPVTSVDPELLALQNARVPKEYTIRAIHVTGLTTLDSAIVVSISGMQPGDKIMIPGSDVFSKAIQNLWKQRLFSDIEIFITAVQGNMVDLEIAVQERPRLGSYRFIDA